jgi:hypothetical protein
MFITLTSIEGYNSETGKFDYAEVGININQIVSVQEDPCDRTTALITVVGDTMLGVKENVAEVMTLIKQAGGIKNVT